MEPALRGPCPTFDGSSRGRAVRVVRDRRVDDLDVGVDRVDLLEGLEESRAFLPWSTTNTTGSCLLITHGTRLLPGDHLRRTMNGTGPHRDGTGVTANRSVDKPVAWCFCVATSGALAQRTERTMSNQRTAVNAVLGTLGIVGGVALLTGVCRRDPVESRHPSLDPVLGRVPRDLDRPRTAPAVAWRGDGRRRGRGGRAQHGIDRHAPAVDRPRTSVGRQLGLLWFWIALAVSWLADAAVGLLAWRQRTTLTIGALALAIGSVLAILGMDRLGLTSPTDYSVFGRLALLGVAMNGFGWVWWVGVCATAGRRRTGNAFRSRLVEREVVGVLVAAGALELDLHQDVVEQRGRAEPEPVRRHAARAEGLVEDDEVLDRFLGGPDPAGWLIPTWRPVDSRSRGSLRAWHRVTGSVAGGVTLPVAS